MATFLIGGLWHGAGWTFLFWGFLHGLALIVQRFWSKLGFKLWSWVAWLITFNFVNIAWIFFRAKEWDDAVKVLSSMFSLDNIVIKEKFSNKLNFLSEYNVQFGEVMKMTHDGSDIINWMVLTFILIFVFKNSMEKAKKFKTNFWYLLIHIIILFIALSTLNTVSEFLYFNF